MKRPKGTIAYSAPWGPHRHRVLARVRDWVLARVRDPDLAQVRVWGLAQDRDRDLAQVRVQDLALRGIGAMEPLGLGTHSQVSPKKGKKTKPQPPNL